jgi:hypothetical protein
MRPTPNHRAVKRVLMQNILLQNMLCILNLTVFNRNDRSEAGIVCLYFNVER